MFILITDIVSKSIVTVATIQGAVFNQAHVTGFAKKSYMCNYKYLEILICPLPPQPPDHRFVEMHHVEGEPQMGGADPYTTICDCDRQNWSRFKKWPLTLENNV